MCNAVLSLFTIVAPIAFVYDPTLFPAFLPKVCGFMSPCRLPLKAQALSSELSSAPINIIRVLVESVCLKADARS